MKPLRRERAFAFVATLWVITALTGLALMLGYSVRVEALAAANRLAQAQADAAERGAEQFVLAAVDSEVSSPGSAATVSMEDVPVGDCHVWVLQPHPDDEQTPSYGLTDEAGKIDLNTASPDMLQMLPGMTPDIVASIVNWRGPGNAGGGSGADDTYYQSNQTLEDRYNCKHAPFETVEELLLIRDIDTSLMFGSDRNRTGTIEARELQAGNTVTLFSGANGTLRGIFPCVTVYGILASTPPPVAASTTRPVNVNGNPNALNTPLSNALGASRAQQIISAMPEPPRRPNYTSVFQWAVEVRLTAAEFSKVIHLVSATPAAGGAGGGAAGAAVTAKLNLNTASRQALLCLPGLTETEVDAIIAHRQNNLDPVDPSDISWVLDAITDRTRLRLIGSYISGTSSCFSADIVATSPDGRAFKRCRIVVDGSSGTSKIIYRRDLTTSGWPLPPELRAALRTGDAAGGSPSLSGRGATSP